MNTFAAGGGLTMCPGQGLPAIRSSRASLAGLLLRGKPASAAALQLPRLFSLCGEAHRLTAGLAVDAALGLRTAPRAPERASLAAETAREHVRRLLIDWPRLLGGSDGSAAHALRACPLFAAGTMEDNGLATPALRAWVERELLGGAIAPWLARWRDDPADCLRHWSRRAATLPALLLRAIEDDASAIDAGVAPLLPHASAASLRVLGAALAGPADFERAPSSAGEACETGTWTRLDDPAASAGGVPANAWLRMGARLAELCALASGDGPLLSLGALALAPGAALAWSEMARGLLLHWVRLDLAGGAPVIVDYRVVAPTEWNFHPCGVVAQALAAMPAARCSESRAVATRRIGVLAAAFDPCVDFKIEFPHA